MKEAYVRMLLFYGGLLLGHSCAKYARGKKTTAIAGIVMLIISLIIMYQGG